MVLIMPQAPKPHVVQALAVGRVAASNGAALSSHGPKLMDRLREGLRSRHYSGRTEHTYCHWVKRFIYFHKVRHPAEMAEPEVKVVLKNLTGDRWLMAR